MDQPPAPPRRRAPLALVAAACVLAAAAAALAWGGLKLHDASMGRRLMQLMPDETLKHRELVRFAVAQGRPLYLRHCAACHGPDLKGRSAIGAPNLVDRVWLYGDKGVFGIERTVLYGARSQHWKSHNVTEMPAFGLRGQLRDADIANVVQYLLQLSRRPHDAQAAELGKTVYYGPAACYDCHAQDAQGNDDYGAPDLTANVWNYGGDVRALHDSVYYGRHGVMPAQIGKLSLEQIRAVSIYVYTASHH